MTTTATHAGFISDICEHPEDDSIRLIYADWLEDHGDPERAEFIRVQVELFATYGNRLDRLRPIVPTHECVKCGALWQRHHSGWSLASDRAEQCCDNEDMADQIAPIRPEMNNLFRRELEVASPLLRRLSEGVIPGASMSHFSPSNPLPYFALPGPGPVFINIAFRRGFLAEIHAPLTVLEKHLPALVRQHPITRVRVTDKEPKHYQAIPFYREHWSWWGNDMPDKEDIPMELFQLLSGDDPSLSNQLYPDCKNFPTAEAAHAALSEVMLRLARGMV